MRLGRIEVTPGFLLLAAWLNYGDDQNILLPALASCTLHELGHLWALNLLGAPVERIRITAAGAEMRVGEGLSYRGELFAALMGPCVNLLLAAVLCRVPGGAMLAGMNLVLGCFNLLPVGGLDGGRVLRCLASLALGWRWGERLHLWFSVCSCLVVCGVSLRLAGRGGNLTLTVVAVWLFFSMLRDCEKRRVNRQRNR